jgi:hypothetical protein
MKRSRSLLLTVLAVSAVALSGCAAAQEKSPAAVPAGSSFKPGEDHEEKLPATLDEAQRDFEQRWQSFQAAGNDCVTLCKALSSMKRAADHLCAMSDSGGDADKKRCSDAKDKVATASNKVKETCGGC